MSKNLSSSTIALLLVVSLVAPEAFLLAPQRAQAEFLSGSALNTGNAATDIAGGVSAGGEGIVNVSAAADASAASAGGAVNCIPIPMGGAGIPSFDFANTSVNFRTCLTTAIGLIQQTITSTAAVTSAAANVAMQINAYVLQPLAFVLSGKLMKLLTAGVIGFVIGKANGTGAPQFVADVMKTMQTVSDSQQLAYLKQMKSTNSPFASSISSALNKDYLSRTSLAGFWAANMCNLKASSPNVNAYLNGNWSQGGITAWFALTTQVQNNPYTLYQRTQTQLAGVIGVGGGGATGARASQLSWGQGFMSWCGANEGTATQPAGNNPDEASASPAVKGVTCTGTDKYDSDTGTCVPTALGVNPGDACTNADGTPGTIKTPGSTIKATLDKVLGGQQDQIVRMGNVGGQITSILGDIATIMNTVNFASQLLGGSDDNGGLLGVGNSSSSGTSRLAVFQDTTNYLGVSNKNIYKDAATISSSGTDMESRVTQYRSAWGTIGASASTASTSVASLITFCKDASVAHPELSLAALAQANAGQVALDTEIVPIFAQASMATTNANAATAMVQKVQAELQAGADSAGSSYATDLQTLQTMVPTARDVATAQQNALSTSGATATASPAGSLTVASTSSSIVDQMNLISANAQSLKTTVCTPSPAIGGI